MKALQPIQALRLSLSPYRLQSRHYWNLFQRAGLRQRRVEVPRASLRLWAPGRLHARQTSAPPLLLIHGFGASATWQWYAQVGPLGRSRALYVPDLIGFGGSERRSGPPSLDAQAEAVLAMADHQRLPRVDILGVSYGGFVAMRVAQRWPDRVRRVVIVDSPGHGYTEDDYQAMIQRFQVAHIAELLLPARPADIRRLLRVAWTRPPWVPEFALPDIHLHMFSDRVAEKRALLDDLLTRLRAGEALGTLPHRALVLWGEEDPIFPLHLAARLAGHLNAELRSLPQTAHTPNMERPQRFNTTVDAFLRAA